MTLSPEDVQDILSLLDALPVDELDLQTERFRLTLRRSADGQWTQSVPGMPATPVTLFPNAPPGQKTLPAPPDPPAPGTEAPAGAIAPPGTEAPAAIAPPGIKAPAGTVAPEAETAGLAEVRAPLPGTFYRAPKPGAPPFVEVGSRVGEETVIGIIETMKMFNPIPAGLAGRVAAIELADAEFAEQDAVLMRIAPEDR